MYVLFPNSVGICQTPTPVENHYAHPILSSHGICLCIFFLSLLVPTRLRAALWEIKLLFDTY